MAYIGDKKKEYQRQWMAKRRQEWIDSKGGCCIDCGSKDRIEVDHIDASTKLLTPAKLWSLALDNPRRQVELAKCTVRCHDCHTEKTFRNKEYIRGETVKTSKLTNSKVKEIRELYATGKYSCQDLANTYSVHKTQISRVVTFKTWEHVN